MTIIFLGDTPLKDSDPKLPEKKAQGEFVNFLGDSFYKIRNFDAMEPFFISIISSSDHWLFIASTGGISAGRVSAEQAIFPYYTVDKITENSENTGHKAILLVQPADQHPKVYLWEPFSDRQRGVYATERSLYKNVSGTALVFEERNLDLGLVYRYAWRTSDRFGFVKTSWLASEFLFRNESSAPCQVELLDGIQNLLPANVVMATQNTMSSLLDAYKRSELIPQSGDASTPLGIFALNSTLSDLAEPSESLRVTTVAQVGLPQADYLLSSQQLDHFRAGKGVVAESEVRGQRGAYFTHATLNLAPQQSDPESSSASWHLLVDTGQDAAAVVQKIHWLRGDQADLLQDIESDIASGQARLWEIVASADGLQLAENPLLGTHHFANVVFNVMRGGIFADQYWIQTRDLLDFVSVHDRLALRAHAAFFSALPPVIHLSDWLERVDRSGSSDLIRLGYAYLPLTFSRRHGDPSRPWNRFVINIKQPDGSLKLDYEGNWRDIFQNWEALAYSYPEFVESMISTFLNAVTADGYNPYRITHHGVDWEVVEPGNPWANIGYWSDHQIIYLQKLMEISHKMHPGKLQEFLDRPSFSCANVPYRIKPYADLLKDPYNTIHFDWELEKRIHQRVAERGTDGKLLYSVEANQNPPDSDPNEILYLTLAEKLLILLLAKLANFVPEGGIWMNTQRPEWNDANNALVGKGLSVVTLCYLRRYVVFCKELFARSPLPSVQVKVEIRAFYERVCETLNRYHCILPGAFTSEQRRSILDELGQAGSDYRWQIYPRGFSWGGSESGRSSLSKTEVVAFLDLVQTYIEHSLHANRRADHLYHAYNILQLSEGGSQPGRASIRHLYEMLEGQTAILSSGMLSAGESLALLESLRSSALYQPGQHSYILYPDRTLPSFLEKNRLRQEQIDSIALLKWMAESGDRSIITRDLNGDYHFSGHIRNFKDVNRALETLRADPAARRRCADLLETEEDFRTQYEMIHALFEDTFHHDEFTGRSGTFFAYEGLGSVYWHMVAKLLLAVQETVLQCGSELATAQEQIGTRLLEKYIDIRQGLGFNKSPKDYGAFPADPYSHTPRDQGAKQPGMTGLVKEEILTRQAELGYTVQDGRLIFDLQLFDPAELLTTPMLYAYLDVNNQRQTLELQAGCLAYTICQTPVILQADQKPGITIHWAGGSLQHIEGQALDHATSRHIFLRDGQVHHLRVSHPFPDF